jgi:hypothetical protein
LTIYLALVHLRDVACEACGAPLAVAGARSFIVDEDDEPVGFEADKVPEEMTVELRCPAGHITQLFVPNEIGAEETMQTPEDAPIGADAFIV